jgi:hypothetical protein
MYLRQTTSGAAGIGLGTAMKDLMTRISSRKNSTISLGPKSVGF